MRVLDLKCPNCGAKLDIDNINDFFNCNVCGATLYLEMSVKEKEFDPEVSESINFFRYMKELFSKCDELKVNLKRNDNIYVVESENEFSDDVDIVDICQIHYNGSTNVVIEYPEGLNSDQKESKTYSLFFAKAFYDEDDSAVRYITKAEIEHIREYYFYVLKAVEYAKRLTNYVEMYNASKNIQTGTYTMSDLDKVPSDDIDAISDAKREMLAVRKSILEHEIDGDKLGAENLDDMQDDTNRSNGL